MPGRLLLATGLLALLAGALARQDDPEAACTVERLDFYYDALAERDEGPEARASLIRRADALLARWDADAPQCTGRLREARTYVLIMDDRDEQIVRELEPYLAGPGRRAEARSKILLASYLSLALLDLGRTRDAARVRYEAAGHAPQAPALIGVSAFNDAASIATVLGDADAAADYLRAALAFAADSAATDLGGDLTFATTVGRTYVSLGLQLHARLKTLPPGPGRETALKEMTTVAEEALERLGTDRARDRGLRSIALALRALALSHQARASETDADLAAAERMAIEAGFRAPWALYSVLLITGEAYEVAGHLDRARSAYRRSREDARRRNNPDEEAEALERLGHLAERARDWDRAATLYADAIERRESFRDRIGLDDWSSLAFASRQAPYRGLVRTRLAQGRTADAFATLDQTRARYLRDLRDHLAVRRHLTPTTRAHVDSLATELGVVRAELAEARAAADQARLRERVSALQARIEESTAAPRSPLEPLDVAALQQRLGAEGQTLIAYFVDRDGSYAFVVCGATIEAVPLGATRASIRAALRAAGAPWRDGTPDPAFDLAALHRLYGLLVAPIAELVLTERVVIVPDIEVATVPFAALTSAPAERYEDAPYLLREWTLSTELSAALVADGPAPAAPAIDVLAFGQGVFEGNGSTWNGLDLVHVAREVDRVSAYAGSEAYLGETATEERFAERAGAARVIHIASHAEADPALPLYSRIALGASPGRDGTLHLYELLEMTLDADLVVLSGCSTAGGGERDGEGIVGLQYGMRAAGAEATVATLWPVADAATADLMGAFYDGLADGLGKDEALRRAQLTYLEGHAGLAASPFYWAAPVLSGSPAPVPLRRRTAWPLLAIVTGLAALAGLVWRLHSPRPRA